MLTKFIIKIARMSTHYSLAVINWIAHSTLRSSYTFNVTKFNFTFNLHQILWPNGNLFLRRLRDSPTALDSNISSRFPSPVDVVFNATIHETKNRSSESDNRNLNIFALHLSMWNNKHLCWRLSIDWK